MARSHHTVAMRRAVGGSAMAALCASLLIVPAGPAYASCASDSGPLGSSIIFVGTAVEERRGYTRFEVSEVWEGPALAPEIWVLSGQEQPTWPLSLLQVVGGSNDASFESESQYIVGASRSFQTNDCVVEAVGASDPATPQPDDVQPSTKDGLPGADPPIGPVGQGLWLAGIAAVVGAAVFARRRQRRASVTPPEASVPG